MANGGWRLQLRDFSAYETVPASIWADVARILRRLDGVRHDDAILDYLIDGGVSTWLILGGGADERVVVGLQLADVDDVLHLVDPTQGEARW